MTQYIRPELPPGWDTDDLWRRFRAAHRAAVRPAYRTAWAAAAVLVLGLAIGASIHWVRREPAKVLATRPGERMHVQLSDGSRVVLGPASRLTVSGGYGRSARTVTLDGEGFFQVVHNVDRPFEVQTAQARIRDVGTAFVTRAYADEGSARVMVTEGEISVRAAGTGSTEPHVRAGGVATIDQRGDVRVAPANDSQRDLAWLQGGLAFDDTPFRDVVRELARNYDLDITVADSSLLTQHVTASFSTAPLDRILAAVVLPLGAEVERDGRRVIIRRRTASLSQPVPVNKTALRTVQLSPTIPSE